MDSILISTSSHVAAFSFPSILTLLGYSCLAEGASALVVGRHGDNGKKEATRHGAWP